MNLRAITFITGNAAKAEQLGRHLDVLVNHQKIELHEIQSLDLKEVVEHKAKEAYKFVQKPVLVEDTALTFSALGKLPGPLIKWFLTELDNAGLSKLLNGYKDRSAKAEIIFGLYDGSTMLFFDGAMEGEIAAEPKGDKGFGWDPVFIPKGYSKTWGEMDIEEQKETSMRRIALKKLEVYLRSV